MLAEYMNKEKPEMIGLALFLINEDGEKELGYRFRANFWGKWLRNRNLRKECWNIIFIEMNVDKVMADVNIANIGSVNMFK